MNRLFALIGKVIISISRVNHFFIKQYQISKLKQVGSGVRIGKNCTFTNNISIGNDVHVGRDCCFQSSDGEIQIGNHVMFGPGVHIHGGNHKFDKIGYLIKENDKKEPLEDGVIIIEDDVWIGAKAIILKGVKIGKGSIIGAGSIVTKNIPPYSIYTGVPAAKLRQRWSDDIIQEHEAILKKRNLL